MAQVSHTNVALDNIKDEHSNRTFKMSGSVTKADEGKAVSLDTTAANTVKLAADGDAIVGRLEIYEPGRATCTVQLHFTETLPVKAGETITLGDTVVGAGAGEVKAAVTDAPHINFVVEVRTGFVVVVKY
jgi:hypothetical protein